MSSSPGTTKKRLYNDEEKCAPEPMKDKDES
jgi:hypothetical protein